MNWALYTRLEKILREAREYHEKMGSPGQLSHEILRISLRPCGQSSSQYGPLVAFTKDYAFIPYGIRRLLNNYPKGLYFSERFFVLFHRLREKCVKWLQRGCFVSTISNPNLLMVPKRMLHLKCCKGTYYRVKLVDVSNNLSLKLRRTVP